LQLKIEIAQIYILIAMKLSIKLTVLWMILSPIKP